VMVGRAGMVKILTVGLGTFPDAVSMDTRSRNYLVEAVPTSCKENRRLCSAQPLQPGDQL
jgi:hypothetical protein